MAERNVTVVRRAVDSIWNRGDLDMADRLFDPAYVNHGGLITDIVRGPEAIKISVALYRTAFPSLSIAIGHLVADGDMVELEWVAHAPPGDRPGGGDHVNQEETLTGTTRSRLAHGQIVESWTEWDREAVMRRLVDGAERGQRPDHDASLAHRTDAQSAM